MNLLIIVLLVGTTLLAIASVVALLHAIFHAEEGFEDSTGYHAMEQTQNDCHLEKTQSATQTVDTGNPWDQIEGACCPIDLSHSFPHFHRGKFSPHES